MSNTSSSPNPFPPCVHSSWGAGDSADKFDLIPQQTGSIVQTVKGVAEIKFKLGAKYVIRVVQIHQCNYSVHVLIIYFDAG